MSSTTLPASTVSLAVATKRTWTVAVVIPSFRVKRQILDVLSSIGSEVTNIYVVDDKCPEGTGDFAAAECRDPRVRVLRHARNRGVGGATMTGYRQAIEDGADIIVKVDGDGQMDLALISRVIRPIIAGKADYTKGNRFFELDRLGTMPRIRLFGNTMLSFLAKLSTGYWAIFDPTNGFTAVHAKVAQRLPLGRISQRYFFETDLLFRLNTLRAVVVDIPMDSKYGDETSNLRISSVVGEFGWKNVKNLLKRIFYNYYLRDFSAASIELLLGSALVIFGTTVGTFHWINSAAAGSAATSGTVMLAALPIILGVQLLLAFLAYDMQNVPRSPIHLRL
ncbi:MAG: glycosyltransferase family 2 protein [Planctomycetota bacterium]|jgi:glycosyltransferase involved in cell wall biosynthesis